MQPQVFVTPRPEAQPTPPPRGYQSTEFYVTLLTPLILALFARHATLTASQAATLKDALPVVLDALCVIGFAWVSKVYIHAKGVLKQIQQQGVNNVASVAVAADPSANEAQLAARVRLLEQQLAHQLPVAGFPLNK